MRSLMASEIYSLGLVVWSILLNGTQFQKEKWDSNRTLEVEDNGEVSGRQILALTACGDLQGIAIASFSSSMISAISEVDIQFFAEALRLCLAKEPLNRPSAEALLQMLQVSGPCPSSVKEQDPDGHVFDIEWLMENFGPTTRLHAVGFKFVQQLEISVNAVPSAEFELQLSICYAIGFGCERNLNTAIQHMRTSALLGHEKAHEIELSVDELCEERQRLLCFDGSSTIRATHRLVGRLRARERQNIGDHPGCGRQSC